MNRGRSRAAPLLGGSRNRAAVTQRMVPLLAAAAFLTGPDAGAQDLLPSGPDPTEYYRIEEVGLPAGVDPQLGGLDFLPDGRAFVAFHGGEVQLLDPKTGRWSRFAEGLHEPLGVLAISDREILVMQKPELTRIVDENGDGTADLYEAFTDDFGFSGNYHEFAYGPVRDAEGNFYISLNDASTGAGIYEEVRGEFRSLSATREETEQRKFPNKMYSVVPYRGWVLRVTPEGKVEPVAPGFRSPNGLLVDSAGRLFVSENQGDWVGTSALYRVREGHFYGHPVSLIWKDGWDRDPLALDPLELDAMRTRAVVQFPHQVMANSPTQPVIIPDGTYEPFSGQMLVGEMDRLRIVRVMLDEVAGELQGAVVPFIDGTALGQGNNRLAFAPDGSLWIGKTHLKWVGGKGLLRVVPTGKVPLDVLEMKLTPGGFDLHFTRPLDAALARDPASYRFRRYYYAYHPKYGSPQVDTTAVPVTEVRVSEDGRRVGLELAELDPGYLYEMDLSELAGAEGEPLLNSLVVYTVNRLVDGTEPPPGFGVGLPDAYTRRSDAESR